MRRFLVKLILFFGSITALLWLFLARPFVISSAPDGEPILSADSSLLEAHTRKLSLDLSPRDWKHIENLNAAADYIATEFRRTNAKVALQSYTVDGTTFSNVVSEYGTQSKRGTIVVGAHYDACGEFPAADDNASGVAGLLELGRLLSQHSLPFKILLVGYTLEEPPFFGSTNMGSAVHAASLVAADEKVRLMISLEMIGYFSDAPDSQRYPLPLLDLFYPSRGDFLAIVGPFSLSSATLELKKAFLH